MQQRLIRQVRSGFFQSQAQDVEKYYGNYETLFFHHINMVQVYFLKSHIDIHISNRINPNNIHDLSPKVQACL